jgi:hypothetical protein
MLLLAIFLSICAAAVLFLHSFSRFNLGLPASFRYQPLRLILHIL